MQVLGLGENDGPFFSALLLLCQALHAALHPAGRPLLGVPFIHGEVVVVVGGGGVVAVVVGLGCPIGLSFPLRPKPQEEQCSNTPKTRLRLGF